jgi:hypothetical protein
MLTSDLTGVAKLFISAVVVGLILVATSWGKLATIKVRLNYRAFDFTTLVTVNIRSQQHFVGTAHLVSASGFDHVYFL